MGSTFCLGGGAIVGSDKKIKISGADAMVTKPEVPGLHVGKHDSCYMGGPS